MEGDTNRGSRGEVANTLLFGGGLSFELVGVGDIESEMVLLTQMVGRELRVVLENVAESLCGIAGGLDCNLQYGLDASDDNYYNNSYYK